MILETPHDSTGACKSEAQSNFINFFPSLHSKPKLLEIEMSKIINFPSYFQLDFDGLDQGIFTRNLRIEKKYFTKDWGVIRNMIAE